MPFPNLRPHKTQEELLRWAGALTRQLNRDQQQIGSGTWTVVSGVTTTTVTDQIVELGAEVFLQPKNAEAAALTGVFVTDVVDGAFTYEHSLSVGGEEFGYGVIGPGGAGDDQ